MVRDAIVKDGYGLGIAVKDESGYNPISEVVRQLRRSQAMGWRAERHIGCPRTALDIVGSSAVRSAKGSSAADKLLDLTSLIGFASFNADARSPQDRRDHPMSRDNCTKRRDQDPGAGPERQGHGGCRGEEHCSRFTTSTATSSSTRRGSRQHQGRAGRDLEEVQRHGIRNHPDRREIVMFSTKTGAADTADGKAVHPSPGDRRATTCRR